MAYTCIAQCIRAKVYGAWHTHNVLALTQREWSMVSPVQGIGCSSQMTGTVSIA